MSNYLSEEQKEELAKLAEKATPGERKVEVARDGKLGIRVSGKTVSGYMAFVGLNWCHEDQRIEQRANADFIAAANPAAISSLIEENAELKAERLDFENREALCCPEDVGFEEWIGTLKTKLQRAEAERDKLRIERDKFERKYRERIWLSHGCFGMYGDDGEMQCNNGQRHGFLDFKRDSVEKLDAALFAMNLKEIAEKQALKNGAGEI